MRNNFCNSLLALSGGLFGTSTLFVLWFLALIVCRFDNSILIFLSSHSLPHLLLISLVEEGTKFLLIKKKIGQFPYGFLLGFSFGVGETLLKYPVSAFGAVPSRRIWAILIHTIAAGVISYSIKKNKPILGFVVAIIIHTGFNLLIH